MTTRTSWNEYFLKLAREVATRSTCLRAQHGAVIVRDKTIISTGYNGAPRGIEHCDELGQCFRESQCVKPGERYELCKSAHAEQNAICQAAREGHTTRDSTIYVTDCPCLVCAKLIINAGVKEVIFVNSGRYCIRDARLLLETAKLNIVEVPLG